MSQYPSPYTPPQYPMNFDQYQPASGDLLAPARRAGAMLWVIGGLGALMGLCFATVVWAMPIGQILQNGGMKLPTMPEGVSVEEVLRIEFTVIGSLMFIGGLVLALLGTFVRRGSRGASWAALVMVSLATLWILANAVATAIMGNPGFVLALLILAILVMQLVWLVQAIRVSGHVQYAQQQYMAQYWYAQQQQQAYGQATHGYGYGPPPGSPWNAPGAYPQAPAPPPGQQPVKVVLTPPPPPPPPAPENPQPSNLRHPPLPPDITQGTDSSQDSSQT